MNFRVEATEGVPGFKRAIEFAVGKNVDAVFHSGDLFHNDRHGISESLSSTCREQLSYLRSVNIPFYYILGNHERKEGTKILKTYERDGLATHLSTTPAKVGRHLDLYGVDFIRQSEWEPALLKGTRSNNQYSILTIHQSVQPFSSSNRAIGTVSDVLRWAREHCGVNFDALALGHLHKQIEQDTDGCKVVCGGSTAPIGYKKTSLTPSVGLFSASPSGMRYHRYHL
ncbi:metallophosphoesterase family protein [Haloferax sp. YSSS75]|uniref:metallophosphoesterase family protein n=1 Tax=Haloferax sp. YSSS75 TaxID=3388564 RepID=UPI00398D37CA